MWKALFNQPSRRLVTTVLVLLASAALSVAQSNGRDIDVQQSSITIHVSKSGLFSFAGDNHEVRAPISSGTVNVAAKTVELSVESAKLTVLDPKFSADKRAEVQRDMAGPQCLDVGRFPEITFRSTQVNEEKPGAWRVTGDLTLHGQTRSITLHVNNSDGHYRGTAALKQTDFGITPISAGGGTVKVKDELAIDFDVVTRQ